MNAEKMQILEQYKSIFTFQGRYIFLLSGAGTGKSYVMAQRIVSDLITYDNCHWVCVRKKHIDVARSVFEQVQEIIWRYKLQKYFKVNYTNRTIYSSINRSKVEFTGLDDPNRIKSLSEMCFCFMEEADEDDEEDFNILNTRCRSKNTPFNQMVLAFNPPEELHWIPRRWFNSGEILPKFNEPLLWTETFNIEAGKDIKEVNIDYMALRTFYKDNPFLPDDSKAEYEAFKNYNYGYYERYCLGKWSSKIEGSFFLSDYAKYGSQNAKNIIYIDPAWGQTEGKNDFNCILKTSYINGQFHINNCILKQAMTPNEMMEGVYYMIDKGTRAIYYDAKRGQKNHMDNLRANAKIQLALQEDFTNVDKTIPEVLTQWINGNIYMPEDFSKSTTGQEALKQLYNFQGKQFKSKIHDDFPDALICSVHILNKLFKTNNFLKGWL